MAITVTRHALKGIGRGARAAAGATVEAVAQAATVAAVAPVAAVAGVAGGVVKHTVKGVGKGFKTVGKMTRRNLGEAAEAAARGSDDVVEGATKHTRRQITGSKKNAEVSYSNKDGKYYRQVGTQQPVELTSDQYKMHLNGQDAELAAQLAESADAWNFGDVINWAEENQGKALAIAGGVGVAGGALLFGGDDDDY